MNEVKKVKVACILDKFSYECFKYECELLFLSKSTWKRQLQSFKPEFLLVESFWEGIDGSWENEIVELSETENPEFTDLMVFCKNNKIPTVFWNKEDPPNFYSFIDAAKLFDYIFTTDKNCIPLYKQIVNHDRVYSLSFAAQPKIHNPIGKQNVGKISFAGSWYPKKHFLRQVEMRYLLDGAKDYQFDIFDRHYENTEHKFPDEYKGYVRGALEYGEMVETYKRYTIFLNTNIVFDSPTMFSRRVYEITACGTNIVSAYCLGIEEQFSHIIPLVTSTEGTKEWIHRLLNDERLSKELSILGIREIYNKHLYSHRLEEILYHTGLNEKQGNEYKILVFAIITNAEQLEIIISNYNRQSLNNKELVILTKLLVNEETIEKYNITLIDDLSDLLDLVQGFHYLSMMSSNGYYGEHYLLDMYHASIYSEADILGKSSYYKYDQGELSTVNSNNENVYTSLNHLDRGTIFIKLRKDRHTLNIEAVKECLGLIAGNEGLNFKCFSINKYSFIKVINEDEMKNVDENAISKVNIESMKLKTPITSPKQYKNRLTENLYTEGYPGFISLFSSIVTDKSQPIVIYGAGVHTLKAMPLLIKGGYNIIGISDRNRELHGQVILDKEIQSIKYWEKIKRLAIYISSYDFENVIYEELSYVKNNGITLINLYHLSNSYSEDIFKELYLEEFTIGNV